MISHTEHSSQLYIVAGIVDNMVFASSAVIRSFSLSSLAQGAIKNVAIVGGGQMGSGIAQVSAAVGQTVVVVDLDQATLDNSSYYQ